MATSSRWVLARYALFQVPDLILLGIGLAAAAHWWGLPTTAAYWIFGLWVVKDIALYPILRVAYDPSPATDRLTGARGVATQLLDPDGYVVVGSERWIAEVPEGARVPEGAAVRVVGVRGLRLLVEPMSPDGSWSDDS